MFPTDPAVAVLHVIFVILDRVDREREDLSIPASACILISGTIIRVLQRQGRDRIRVAIGILLRGFSLINNGICPGWLQF